MKESDILMLRIERLLEAGISDSDLIASSTEIPIDVIKKIISVIKSQERQEIQSC